MLNAQLSRPAINQTEKKNLDPHPPDFFGRCGFFSLPPPVRTMPYIHSDTPGVVTEVSAECVDPAKIQANWAATENFPPLHQNLSPFEFFLRTCRVTRLYLFSRSFHRPPYSDHPRPPPPWTVLILTILPTKLTRRWFICSFVSGRNLILKLLTSSLYCSSLCCRIPT